MILKSLLFFFLFTQSRVVLSAIFISKARKMTKLCRFIARSVWTSTDVKTMKLPVVVVGYVLQHILPEFPILLFKLHLESQRWMLCRSSDQGFHSFDPSINFQLKRKVLVADVENVSPSCKETDPEAPFNARGLVIGQWRATKSNICIKNMCFPVTLWERVESGLPLFLWVLWRMPNVATWHQFNTFFFSLN